MVGNRCRGTLVITWSVTYYPANSGAESRVASGVEQRRSDAVAALLHAAETQSDPSRETPAGSAWSLALGRVYAGAVYLGVDGDGKPDWVGAANMLAAIRRRLTAADDALGVSSHLEWIWQHLSDAVSAARTGHPDRPATDPMTGADFRAGRESLQLEPLHLGQLLDVDERSIRRWEGGDNPIPAGVAREMLAIETAYWEIVDTFIVRYGGTITAGIGTFRRDPHTHDAITGRFHRGICRHVARKVPGLALIYSD